MSGLLGEGTPNTSLFFMCFLKSSRPGLKSTYSSGGSGTYRSYNRLRREKTQTIKIMRKKWREKRDKQKYICVGWKVAITFLFLFGHPIFE